MRTARRITLLAAWVASVGCHSSSNGSSSGTPSPTVTAFSTAGNSICAVLTSGEVRCWGSNSSGQLGNAAHLGDSSFVPLLAASVTSPTKLAVGGAHTCARVASGAVQCWGAGTHGELGNGESIDRVTPVTVAGISDAIDVAAGFEHSCAVVGGGAVECWGRNEYGQLGDPSTATTAPDNHRPSPVAVAGVSGAIALVAGTYHSCARLGDSSVTCWGGRFNGSPLGAPYHDPVTITSLAGVTAVAAGALHDCAVVAGGRVKCWANNLYGQLGNGAPGDSPTEAVYVTSIDSAVRVTAGLDHSCALLANGTVACWGRNDRGQLGDGTYLDRPAPVTVTGLSGATAVAAGSEHTCAFVTGGEVRCWGDNSDGQLGLDPSLVYTSALPVTIHF